MRPESRGGPGALGPPHRAGRGARLKPWCPFQANPRLSPAEVGGTPRVAMGLLLSVTPPASARRAADGHGDTGLTPAPAGCPGAGAGMVGAWASTGQEAPAARMVLPDLVAHGPAPGPCPCRRLALRPPLAGTSQRRSSASAARSRPHLALVPGRPAPLWAWAGLRAACTRCRPVSQPRARLGAGAQHPGWRSGCAAAQAGLGCLLPQARPHGGGSGCGTGSLLTRGAQMTSSACRKSWAQCKVKTRGPCRSFWISRWQSRALTTPGALLSRPTRALGTGSSAAEPLAVPGRGGRAWG